MLKPFRSGDHAKAEVWVLDEGQVLAYAEIPMHRVSPREWVVEPLHLVIEKAGCTTHFGICLSGFMVAHLRAGQHEVRVGDTFTINDLRIREVPDVGSVGHR